MYQLVLENNAIKQRAKCFFLLRKDPKNFMCYRISKCAAIKNLNV